MSKARQKKKKTRGRDSVADPILPTAAPQAASRAPRARASSTVRTDRPAERSSGRSRSRRPIRHGGHCSPTLQFIAADQRTLMKDAVHEALNAAAPPAPAVVVDNDDAGGLGLPRMEEPL